MDNNNNTKTSSSGNSGQLPSSQETEKVTILDSNTPPPSNQSIESENESDPIKIKITPSFSYALKGIVNDIHVLFEIVTGPLNNIMQKRRPISLALVLDKSGSMSGGKLENSKKAIIRVLDQLTEEDRIHFVVYDSGAKMIFENVSIKDRAAFLTSLEEIKADGYTNLGDGFILGKDILLKYKNQDYLNYIFLFSDGEVNEGTHKSSEAIFTLVDEALKQDITTTSFGIGEGFNELLMKGIADHGDGFFFFIEKETQIDFYVKTAFDILKNSIGKKAILKIQGKNGAIVQRIFPNENLLVGARVREIMPNNSKNVLCQISVSPNSKLDDEEIFTYQLSYERSSNFQTAVISGSFSINFTDDNATALQSQNVEPKIALAIQKSAEINENITALLRAKNIDAALERKKEEIDILKDVKSIDKDGRTQVYLDKALEDLKTLEEKKAKQVNDYEREIKSCTYTSSKGYYDDRNYSTTF